MLFLYMTIAAVLSALLVYAADPNTVAARRVPAPLGATEGAIARARARFAMGEIDAEELERIVHILRD